MSKNIPLHLGREIRIGRARCDMTIAQLAIAAGVHPATVARTEKGRTTPTAPTLARIADALNLPELLERAVREGCDAR